MQQMHNTDSLTTILHISRTNVQHAIFAVRKVILHVIVTLKRKTIIFQDLHSPSINYNHHCITSIRPQGEPSGPHGPLGPCWGHNNNIGTSDHWHESSLSQHLRPPLQYIHARLQQGHRGVHLHHTLDQKTDCGNPCD